MSDRSVGHGLEPAVHPAGSGVRFAGAGEAAS